MSTDPTNPTPATPDTPAETPATDPAQTPAPDSAPAPAPAAPAPDAGQPPASAPDPRDKEIADLQQALQDAQAKSAEQTAPADRVDAAQPSDDPRDAAIEQLLQRIEQLETARATQPGASVGFGPAPAATAINTPQPPENVPDYAQDWPQKGGFDDAPQPWDLHNLGLAVGTANDGTTTISAPHSGQVVQLAPGAPDTISPIVPAHGRPMLASGSAGPEVVELGQLLALLGYDNSISRGQNPNGVLDDTIMGAVDSFRRDYDVEEDPSQFPRDSRANAQSHVGPWTWEAILRAAKRVQDELAVDGRQVAFPRS